MRLILTFLLIFPIIFLGNRSIAQNSPILDNYIKQSFENNLSLKQQQFALDKSLLALKDAKNMFLPTAELDAAYTAANGGRKINLPLGDLLNPVYQALGSPLRLENQSIQFLPNDFQDTKIRIIHPLLNMELVYNREIKKQQITQQQAEVNLYKRQLVNDLKIAYFNYLKAEKAMGIYESAIKVVRENLRVNEKLVKNQMATGDVIFRSKAELSDIDFQMKQAENSRKAAQNYFNFLLNRDFSTPVVIDSSLSVTESINIENVSKREEFTKLEIASGLTQTQLKLNKSYLFPKINHVLDVGYQGFGYKFNADQQYMLYNISLSWNLFSGFRNKIKIKQTMIDRDAIANQLSLVDEQIKLQVENAKYAYLNFQESLESARDAVKNSEAYFKIINKKYSEGQSSLIEYMDARNKLTSAQLRYIINQYDMFIKSADLERVTAGYQF